MGPVCTNGQYCDPTGRCVTAAPPVCNTPQITCPITVGSGTFCTDPAKDPGNCGGCGRVCPGGMVCNNGVCGAQTCGATSTACVGPGGGTFCADLQRDASNCGTCGHVCTNNAICSGGTCQGGGGSYPGLAACVGSGGAPFCTNLLSDPGNCGRCGNICAPSEGCFSGACGGNQLLCTDPAAQKQYCSDPMYDSNNCGQCGHVCGVNMACNNGTCVPSSTDGGTQCGPQGRMCPTAVGIACVNIFTDPQNCGNCGDVCSSNTFCNNATCVPTGTDGGVPPDGGAINCAGGDMACYPAAGPPYCANIGFDPANCGGCFKPCPGGWACQGGTCSPPPDGGTDASMSCQVGFTLCDGTYCTDTTTDKANCGGCHFQCSAVQQCFQGQCT
jgi:hypothetical protein